MPDLHQGLPKLLAEVRVGNGDEGLTAFKRGLAMQAYGPELGHGPVSSALDRVKEGKNTLR